MNSITSQNSRRVPRMTDPPLSNLIGVSNPKRVDLTPQLVPGESLYIQMTVRAHTDFGEDIVNVLYSATGPTTKLSEAKPFNTLKGALAQIKEIRRQTPKGVLHKIDARTASEIKVTDKKLHIVG